jgi:predicted  nucleic acid-binding Zn-ribbon protein
MFDERTLSEKLSLLERELATLTEKYEKLEKSLQEMEDLKGELSAFKVFAGRHHPEFKKEFLEILEKL